MPTRTRWSPQEDHLLKKLYYDAPKDVLISTFNRSYDAVKLHAAKLDLKRSYDFCRESKLTNLLADIPEAYYWIGFLMADGYFANNRIKLTLSTKDTEHLRKFAKFIECDNVKVFYRDKNKQRGCSIAVKNNDVVPVLCSKYSITNNKTIIPCDLSNVGREELLCILAGFIDGDGSIRMRVNKVSFMGTVKCHANWLNNFKLFREVVEPLGSEPKINKFGYAEWNLSMVQLRNLKRDLMKFDLPLLSRKWDIVKL